MFIKVSNPMIKVMKKAIPEYRFKIITLSPESYELHIDFDLMRNTSDFDWNKRVFKAIQVLYPPERYALPRYITTRDLHRIYKSSDGTIEDFITELKKDIEV